MRRSNHKLTACEVTALSHIGWHGDGGDLYLRIREDGAKRWIFVWMRAGRRREMFLCTSEEFSLSEVRDMAAAARQLLKQGLDPLELRKAAAAAAQKHRLQRGSPRMTRIGSDAVSRFKLSSSGR